MLLEELLIPESQLEGDNAGKRNTVIFGGRGNAGGGERVTQRGDKTICRSMKKGAAQLFKMRTSLKFFAAQDIRLDIGIYKVFYIVLLVYVLFVF